MVLRFLKYLFLSILILGSAPLWSQSKSQNSAFSRAKAQFKRQEYAKSIRTLRNQFNFKNKSTPYGAIQLAAYAYEKLENYSMSQYLYGFLIKRKYQAKNRLVMQHFRKNGVEDLPEVPEKLAFYYHHRAMALKELYTKKHDDLTARRRLLFYNTAKMYAEIVMENDDYDDDSVEDILTDLKKFAEAKELSIYKGSWFASASYITWRDKLTLVLQSGAKAEINSTSEGWGFGGGYQYQNATWNFNANACYSFANATVGNDASAFNYFQKNVGVNALFLGPEILYRPTSGEVAIGIATPIVVRSGDYTDPPSGFSLEDTSIFTFGYFLVARYHWNQFGMASKLGKVAKFSSSMWQLELRYDF